MKILHYCKYWGNGGVENIITNNVIYASGKYEIDIICENYDPNTVYKEYLKNHNVKIHKMNDQHQLSKFYDILHINVSSANDLFNIIKLKYYYRKSKVLIYSHTGKGEHVGLIDRVKLKLFSFLISPAYDIGFGCSIKARNTIFSKKDIKIGKAGTFYSGVDVHRYAFNIRNRESIRSRFNIDENFLLFGHVGRISYEKNPIKILSIFRDFNYQYPNSKLLYIGELSENYIKLFNDYLSENNLTDKIIHIEKTNEVERYLSAMDLFLLPSLFEGLPQILIENQVNGLKSVVSNTVSQDVKLLETIEFLGINEDNLTWVDQIIKLLDQDIDRKNQYLEVIGSRFDAEVSNQNLYDIYKKLV